MFNIFRRAVREGGDLWLLLEKKALILPQLHLDLFTRQIKVWPSHINTTVNSKRLHSHWLSYFFLLKTCHTQPPTVSIFWWHSSVLACILKSWCFSTPNPKKESPLISPCLLQVMTSHRRGMTWTWRAWWWEWCSARLPLRCWCWAAGLFWRSLPGWEDCTERAADQSSLTHIVVFIVKITSCQVTIERE